MPLGSGQFPSLSSATIFIVTGASTPISKDYDKHLAERRNSKNVNMSFRQAYNL